MSDLLSAIRPMLPVGFYALLLVSDPDNILADEAALADLVARGFRIMTDTDPVALRHHYCQAAPIAIDAPVIIITPGPLNRLPYDMWQQGHHVTLALHVLFPNLDYPTLQALSTAQRARLAEARARPGWPTRPISPLQTADFLLRTVFDVMPEVLSRPAALLLWLDSHHAMHDPLPPVLAERLLWQLKDSRASDRWPIAELLASPDTYRTFVRTAWSTTLGHLIGESRPEYVIGGPTPLVGFERDPELQDTLPKLVRSGTVVPVAVERPAELPVWTRTAVDADANAVILRRFVEYLRKMEDDLQPADLRWDAWQAIARDWAQLTIWRYQFGLDLPGEITNWFESQQATLDSHFLVWLTANYTSLATRPLPQPRHLHHVPTWLAHRYLPSRRRIALLILDGMAMADWLVIREAWVARHPDWRLAEAAVLAQVPSITSVSRQALISGLRPTGFSASLTQSSREPQEWQDFWHGQGLPPEAAVYDYVPGRIGASYPAAVDSRHTQALCLVTDAIDEMVHGATQGTGDVLGALQIWLRDSQFVDDLVQHLLVNGYIVTVTSDHGHVAAVGIGQPQEGVTVESRSKRARLYDNLDFVQAVQARFPQTILWHGDDVLPADKWVLIPRGREAFVAEGVRVVSHGGVTIEEMIVPLVTITAGSED